MPAPASATTGRCPTASGSRTAPGCWTGWPDRGTAPRLSWRRWEDGANRSGTVAVTGLALDSRVTSVELTRPISPPVRADVVAGTFVLPDIDLDEGTEEARRASSLSVRDTHGKVLATLSLPI